MQTNQMVQPTGPTVQTLPSSGPLAPHQMMSKIESQSTSQLLSEQGMCNVGCKFNSGVKVSCSVKNSYKYKQVKYKIE